MSIASALLGSLSVVLIFGGVIGVHFLINKIKDKKQKKNKHSKDDYDDFNPEHFMFL